MTCAACSKVISLILRKIAGVSEVAIDEKAGLVKIVASASIPFEQLREKLGEKGYEISQS